MDAKSVIKNPTGIVAEAVKKIKEYSYREKFGLSFKDFEEEPLEEYFVNTDIMNSINSINAKQNKKLDNEAKRAKR